MQKPKQDEQETAVTTVNSGRRKGARKQNEVRIRNSSGSIMWHPNNVP